jgi:hypothetical protein
MESYPRLNAEHRRALMLLADAPHGCSISIMLAHGFSNARLDKLVRDGLATLQPGTVRSGTRRYAAGHSCLDDRHRYWPRRAGRGIGPRC